MSTSRAATSADVTDETFAAEVERSAVPVLVELRAPWCAPCEAVERVLEGVAEEYAGQAKVVRVNIDPDGAARRPGRGAGARDGPAPARGVRAVRPASAGGQAAYPESRGPRRVS